MGQSQQELHEAAWKFTKIRHSKNRDPAMVDQNQQRQHIRCKETRPHWLDLREQPGPPGQRSATRFAAKEQVIRQLPTLELAAYMAMQGGQQNGQNQLVDQMERILIEAERQQDWGFRNKPDTESPIRLLASIIVESWINPAKYFKDSHELSPKVSVFAREMNCDRKTWHARWKPHYLDYRHHPAEWYHRGCNLMSL